MNEIKKLGFGLMRLPQKSAEAMDIDLDQVKQMVDRFLERGFTYFDTSYVYHNGASETAIREALAPYEAKTLRVTKAMPAGDILAALENIVSL